MTLIDGKAISEQVKQEIAAEVAEIVAHGGKRPHLAAILVGHDGGSETYVAAKVKACEVCGFKSSLIRYESDVTEDELLAKVRELNEDDDVDGFIVQLPLPKHISEQKVIETIDYRKDVDGFHPINVGRMSIGLPCYVSATPNGILELLKRYRIETSGKKVRRIGTQQYCWQTDGCTHDAESLSGRRYGDRMSQPLKRSGERVPGSRYHYRCIGTTQFRKGGNGERRCRGH